MINKLGFSGRAEPRPAILGLLLFFFAGFADGALAPFFPVCLQMAVSRMVQARSTFWLTVGASATTLLALALLIISPSMLMLIGAVSLFSVGQMLTGPLLPTAVNALAPQARRAAYMAASSVANDLKDSLGPSLGTALYAIAPRLPWIAGIPLVALASLGSLGITIGRTWRPSSSCPSSKGTGSEAAS
jgi:MFS transporter, DHA1 family, tetracycline resistance protein